MRCPVVPEHGEERLVHRGVAVAPVARVDQVDVAMVEARGGGEHVGDEGHPSHGAARVRLGAVPREVVVEGAAAGCTTTGTISISASAGFASRTPASQSSGAWNCDRSGGVRPVVRPAHVGDRSGVGLRLVQRHPARHHLRRHQIVGVGAVLVEADRLRPGRLPEHVVLEDHTPGSSSAATRGGRCSPTGPGRRSRCPRARRCRAAGCGLRGSLPLTQLTSSGLIPVSYSPSKRRR